jgi:uncharacterized membrane protein
LGATAAGSAGRVSAPASHAPVLPPEARVIVVLAFLIGVVSGLRTMTAPAVLSLGAALGWLPVAGTWAGFMGYRFTPWILSAIALGEYLADQLPTTPSRKVPPQFAARIASGAFCGAVIGSVGGGLVLGLIAGAPGAVAGTLGGAEARARLAAALGNDRLAAFLEDAVAIVLALVVVSAVA